MLVFEQLQKDLKTLTFRTLLNTLSVFFLTGGNYYSETPDETWTGCVNEQDVARDVEKFTLACGSKMSCENTCIINNERTLCCAFLA